MKGGKVQGAKPYEQGVLPMKKSGNKKGGVNCTKSSAKTWGKGNK